MVDYSGNPETLFKKRIWIINNKLYEKSIDMSGLISSSQQTQNSCWILLKGTPWSLKYNWQPRRVRRCGQFQSLALLRVVKRTESTTK